MNNTNKNENIYVLLLAFIQFTHMVDFVVIMPLGPTLMDVFKITPIEFGTLVSSYNFSAALSGFIFGLFADQYGRKKLILFAIIGFFISTLLCSVSSNFNLLLCARIMSGVFGGILNALIFAVVSELVPYERRGKALGKIMASFSLASIFGVPLGLALADNFGWNVTFISVAILAVIIFIMSLKIFPAMDDFITKRNYLDILRRYGKILIKKKYVVSYIYIFIISFSMFLLIPYLSPFAVKNMGIKTYQLKYMYLIGGIFTVFTAQIFGRMTDQFGAWKIYTFIGFLSSVPIYLYTNSEMTPFYLYIIISSLFMSLVSGRMIPAMTLISGIPSDFDRGSFMGLLNSVRSLGSAVGTLLGGILIIENDLGKIERFSYVGLITIFFTIFAVFLAFYLSGKHSSS